jgi:hypothetical protein
MPLGKLASRKMLKGRIGKAGATIGGFRTNRVRGVVPGGLCD